MPPAKVIVFPVWPDLGSLIGDTSEHGGPDRRSPPGTPLAILPDGGNAVAVDASVGADQSGPASFCPLSAGEAGKESLAAPRLSYSVSYFSWSVSEDSEEEDAGLEALSSRLERVKIRRSSRERNELRSAAAAAHVSLRLPPPVLLPHPRPAK